MTDTPIETKVFRLFSEGSALTMALGVAELLTAANPDDIVDDTMHKAGWCITNLLRVVEWERRAEWEKEWDKGKRAEQEKKTRRRRLQAYFDPKTDEATRAKLEPFISDEDLQGVLHELDCAEKSARGMAEQDKACRQMIEALKAKRASGSARRA